MLYIPLKHLRPGMVLAQDVVYGVAPYPLLCEGQHVTQVAIDKLDRYAIPGVYVHNRMTADVQAENFINLEICKEIYGQMKKVFDEVVHNKCISSAADALVTAGAEKLVSYVLSKTECMFTMVDVKTYDNYTFSHSLYVSVLSVMLGMQIGLPHAALVDLAAGGLLHDVGKLEIPLEIVNKQSRLSPEEMEVMRQHPVYAARRLQGHGFSARMISGIRHHHEKFDGTGYPDGLAGEKIPLYARVLALADVFDALTSERSYREAWPPHEALEYMMGGGNTHFDFTLLKSFLKIVAAYPVGSLVRLSNGAFAVVIKNSQQDTLRPQIRLLYPQEIAGKEIDLSTDMGYLNVTISEVAGGDTELPEVLLG